MTKPLWPSRLPIRNTVQGCAAKSSLNCSSSFSRRRSFATQAIASASPATGFAPLPDRKLIAIAGLDAPKFLQGLITASIYKSSAPVSEEPRNEGFYTAFLTATGRVLHDVFIHPNPEFYGISDAQRKGLLPNQSFLIEVAHTQLDALYALMRRYKLRSKFVHTKVGQEDGCVYTYWNEALTDLAGPPEALARNKAEKRAYVTQDSRAPGMGWRIITNNKEALGLDVDECDQNTYTVRRYLRGVAEGPDEIAPDKTLPLDANIDLMGGIDFRKGCYVGQELTIRTKHRGVVRKRILPCVVYSEGEPVPQELLYKPGTGDGKVAESIPTKTDIGLVDSTRKRSTGHWIKGLGNVGLAMCRLQSMTDVELPGENAETPFDSNKEFMLKWDSSDGGSDVNALKIKPFIPNWVRQKLSQSASHHRATPPEMT